MKKGLEFLLAGTLALSTLLGGCRDFKEELGRHFGKDEIVEVRVENKKFSINGRRYENIYTSPDKEHIVTILPEAKDSYRIASHKKSGEFLGSTVLEGNWREVESIVIGNKYFALNIDDRDEHSKIFDYTTTKVHEEKVKDLDVRVVDIQNDTVTLEKRREEIIEFLEMDNLVTLTKQINYVDPNTGNPSVLTYQTLEPKRERLTGSRNDEYEVRIDRNEKEQKAYKIGNQIILEAYDNDAHIVLADPITKTQTKIEKVGSNLYFEEKIDEDNLILRVWDRNTQEYHLEKYNLTLQNFERITTHSEWMSLDTKSKNKRYFEVWKENPANGNEEIWLLDVNSKKEMLLGEDYNITEIFGFNNNRAIIEYRDDQGDKKVAHIDLDTKTITNVGVEIEEGEMLNNNEYFAGNIYDGNGWNKKIIDSDGNITSLGDDNIKYLGVRNGSIYYLNDSTGSTNLESRTLNTGSNSPGGGGGGSGSVSAGETFSFIMKRDNDKIFYAISRQNAYTNELSKIVEYEISTGNKRTVLEFEEQVSPVRNPDIYTINNVYNGERKLAHLDWKKEEFQDFE